MTLLTIVQGALQELGESEVPLSVVGNNADIAVQMLALANQEGRELSREHPWQALTIEHTFTTTNGTASYSLPADFRSLITATWWDRTNYWRLFGPASPQQWQELNSGIVTEGIRRWFTIRGDKFVIWPTPTVTGDTIAYDYISSYWVDTDADQLGEADAWAADSNTSILDEFLMQLGLVWRFKRAKSMPFLDDHAIYRAQVDIAKGKDGANPVLDMSGHRLGADLVLNVKEGNFG